MRKVQDVKTNKRQYAKLMLTTLAPRLEQRGRTYNVATLVSVHNFKQRRVLWTGRRFYQRYPTGRDRAWLETTSGADTHMDFPTFLP